jgi:hypothetical protein
MRLHQFMLSRRTIRHRHEPDVDVKPDLVALVSERKRAAPRLRHVADQDSLPASGFGGRWREAFQELHQFRMAPIAITTATLLYMVLALEAEQLVAIIEGT